MKHHEPQFIMWLVIFNFCFLVCAAIAICYMSDIEYPGIINNKDGGDFFVRGFALFGMVAMLIGGNWLIERGNRKSGAVAAAEAKYNKVHKLAWAEYKKARDAAKGKKEFYKVRDVAYAEFKKVTDPAWAEYKKALDAETWDGKDNM